MAEDSPAALCRRLDLQLDGDRRTVQRPRGRPIDQPVLQAPPPELPHRPTALPGRGDRGAVVGIGARYSAEPGQDRHRPPPPCAGCYREAIYFIRSSAVAG